MNLTEELKYRMDDMLTLFFEQEPTAGLAVGIVKDQQNLYTKGFGVKSKETGEAVNELTLFHMASVSKPFVAIAIMQLVDQGKLELDSPVTNYVSYFSLADDRQQEITIRQLLSHTSGMPDEDDFQWDHPEFDEESLERYVRSMASRKLSNNPSEVHAYSNIGYELLGDVIAKVSGSSFESYMKEHVLAPAKMIHSSYLLSEVPAEQMASPHILGLNEGYGPERSVIFPYHRAHGPSSTLYSNVLDMCEFMKTHLNQGRMSSHFEILRPEIYSQMWSAHASTGYGQWLDGIGLGWYVGEYKGHHAVCHMGRDTGFRSYLILLPDLDIGITVMINVDYIGIKVVVEGLLDVLLGEDLSFIKCSLAHYLSGMALSAGNEAAWNEYIRIKREELERFITDDEDFNSIAYTLMRKGFLSEAIQLLELAVRIYPDSSNLFDSLGEMCEKSGQLNQALNYFTKSVELNSNHTEGIQKIDELTRLIG